MAAAVTDTYGTEIHPVTTTVQSARGWWPQTWWPRQWTQKSWSAACLRCGRSWPLFKTREEAAMWAGAHQSGHLAEQGMTSP